MEVPVDIIEKLPRQTFTGGEKIISQGDASKGRLYFLVSGSVVVEKDGQTITEEKRPGSTFGETSILLDVPHNASVIASGETVMAYAEDPDLFLHDNPAVMVLIGQILARRLHAMTAFFTDAQKKYGDQLGLGTIEDMIYKATDE